MTESTTLAVPPGYPSYLPKPTLRNGGLYLEPYPAMPDKTVFTIDPKDFAWVMVALQPYVLQYSDRPYDVNWVIDGWGSGKVHIAKALTGKFGGFISMGKPMAPENFLEHPREPSGFDKFLISLNTQIGTLMGRLFDSIVPGTGQTVKKLIDRETWSGPAQPVDLTPVYEEIQQDEGGGLNIDGTKPNYLLWAGIAAAAAAIYLIYDSDS